MRKIILSMIFMFLPLIPVAFAQAAIVLVAFDTIILIVIAVFIFIGVKMMLDKMNK